jgi:hypothetical protein
LTGEDNNLKKSSRSLWAQWRWHRFDAQPQEEEEEEEEVDYCGLLQRLLPAPVGAWHFE